MTAQSYLVVLQLLHIKDCTSYDSVNFDKGHMITHICKTESFPEMGDVNLRHGTASQMIDKTEEMTNDDVMFFEQEKTKVSKSVSPWKPCE